MNLLLVLPILIPFFTAVGMLLAWGRPGAQRVLSAVGSALLLLASLVLFAAVRSHGPLATQLGGWPAPFGVTFVADLLAAIMVVLVGLTGFSVVIYSLGSIDRRREALGYHPLVQILLMGVCGAHLAGDLFNLYVWFEVMLIASFVLMVLGGGRAQLEGAIKYVALNLISSALFLAAVGILYGEAGSLNMADLAAKLSVPEAAGITTTVAMLFLAAFGVKAAIFPLFFWLPASYHNPHVAVSALFAGLLTKVGVYALLRVFTLLFVQDIAYTHEVILVAAGFTMVTGVLGAAARNDIRRILSFHIVSQIGYMVMGLGLLTPLGLAGGIFYIMHHVIVKTNLFLVGGMVLRLKGSEALADLGGLYRSHAGLAILFLIPALSLAGVPPLSGFFAKLALVKAGLEVERYGIVLVALAVGLLTLFSMTKIWAEVFWKESGRLREEATAQTGRSFAWLVAPSLMLAGITLAMGLGAEWFFQLASDAAQQLLDPSAYIAASLGPPR